MANEQTFRGNFAIDVRTNCEAIAISRQDKTVRLRNGATGEVTTERYDRLVLSPGAPSVRPPLHGFRARNISGGMLARAMFPAR